MVWERGMVRLIVSSNGVRPPVIPFPWEAEETKLHEKGFRARNWERLKEWEDKPTQLKVVKDG